MSNETPKQSNILKCVVWDLDNTIWNGILLEDGEVTLKPEIVNVIKDLDRLGILNSIASKNDFNTAYNKLAEYHLEEYFLYPQIGWQPKSDSIEIIKHKLNIGYDTILFVDDDKFEREEVNSWNSTVQCIDASEYEKIFELYTDRNAVPSDDAKNRRKLYQNEHIREELEKTLRLPKAEFLRSLNMKLIIQNAKEEHLHRCEELTLRTHQLNSTGIGYSEKELAEFIHQCNKRVLVCELVDRIGSYGMIALAYIDIDDVSYNIRLLITSCRVMSRGIGSVLLSNIMQCAKNENKIVTADFVDTGKNRNMYITYKFNGFKETMQGGNTLFSHDCVTILPIPDYVKLTVI